MDKYFVQAGAADTGVRYYGFLTPTRKLESEKLFEDCLVLLLMNLASFPDEAGGFLQPNLPSSRSPTSSNGSILPYPRSTPLKPGSKKESSFIGYVDQTLLGISRRYELRTNQIFEDQLCSDIEVKGYKDFGEVAGDLDVLTDVVWVSGSPSLQTPYFLTIALELSSYMVSFPFSPQPTFQLLQKLDVAFSSLLREANVQTGVCLPGFENGRGRLSTTEKVRIRSLVERTRVAVVEVAGENGSGMDSDSARKMMALSYRKTGEEFMTDYDGDETTEGSNYDNEPREGLQDGKGNGRWEMEVARVYERTIVELGLSLDSGGISGFD